MNLTRGAFPRVFLAAALMALLSPFAARAQAFRGSIVGTVTDTSGAAIAGAKITARNVATGLVRDTVTSSDGSYVIPQLPIGTYTVTVEKSGFQTSVTTDVIVQVAVERGSLDIVLKAGAVTQHVTVSAATLPQIQTTSDVLGGVLTPSQFQNLSINGRDFDKLLFLVPGVAGSPDMITDSPGSFGVFSMNGARGRSNNYLLDGTDMNDGYRNDPALNEGGVFADPSTLLPVDAISELHLISNYMPEFGRNAGAIVNIVTKSGTNTLHGDFFNYFRNNWLDARNFFNTKGIPQDLFRNNQFGGSLGGPIVKDKTFFFLNYEGQREGGGLTILSCAPSANSFAIATAAIGGPQNINPVIKKLLATPNEVWPTPNLSPAVAPADDTGCTTSQLNVAATNTFFNRLDSGIVKIDHNINKNNLLTGRYFIGDSDQGFPLGLVGSGFLPGFNTITPTRVQLVSISWVDVLSPTQVNEARIGWNRFAEGFFPQDRGFLPASIGLNTGVSSYDSGLPKITVGGSSGGFATLGATTSIPRQRVDTNWQFIDSFSWKKARHDWKFGFEWRKTSISQILDSSFRGSLAFNTLEDFLQGIVSGGGSIASGDTNRNTYENNYGAYFQDSFRWTPRLTLNYGLRWDLYGVIEEKHGLFFNINPFTGVQQQEGTPGLPRLYEPDYKDFAPRVSIAYDLTGKGQTVIRAGYGIFYDAYSQDFFIGNIPYNSSFDPGSAYAGIGPGNNAITLESIFSKTMQVTPGQPVYVSPAPMSDAFGVDRHIHIPYMQNFNLNIEQAIGSHASLQVGYVGSNGHRLFRFRDINQPTRAEVTAADLACNCINSFLNTTAVPRRVTPNFFFINFLETSANSNYNALQLSLRLLNWHGLTSQANYVWSHSIDNASDGLDFEPNESQPSDSTRASLERGNSSFDIRNRFTWNYTYEFPNWNVGWPKLTQGWGIDGTLTLQDGQPFHINHNFNGDWSGSGELFDRPDVVGPIQYSSDPAMFLSLSSFEVPCTLNGSGTSDQNCVPGTRHFGNLGRSALRGPSFKQFDFSIFKNTPITERMTMQFRANIYNLFNHPNFNNPFLPAFFASAGTPGTNGRSSGFMPLTATADNGEGNPFIGGGCPRGIEIALKFMF